MTENTANTSQGSAIVFQ